MVPFTWVPFWVPIFDPQPHSTGLDGVYSIYQGHLFFQKATYALAVMGASWDWGCLSPGIDRVSTTPIGAKWILSRPS